MHRVISVGIEDITHAVGTHDRCKTTVEPMIQTSVVCCYGRNGKACN